MSDLDPSSKSVRKPMMCFRKSLQGMCSLFTRFCVGTACVSSTSKRWRNMFVDVALRFVCSFSNQPISVIMRLHESI